MRIRSVPLQEVFVWELPVRLYHWINALAILSLAATGFIIGSPPALMKSAEASSGYWFGTVRFVHFVSGFVFFFNFLVRIYWGFAGNTFARWYNFIPLKKCQWKEIGKVIGVEVLQTSNRKLETIGHNQLAGLTYFILFLIFLMQCITGFGMYSAMSQSFLPKLFAWIVPLMGGDMHVRELHHLLMWFFIIFALIHVYLVFYMDYIERQGVTSSMIGGWKFIEKSLVEKHERDTECPKGGGTGEDNRKK